MSCRILLVEDSATQAEALRTVLEEQLCDVTVARSGEEAIERLGESSFDLVLSDIVMPGIDGCELCRRIKADPQLKITPVVLLTTLSDPVDIIRGLECGADNYITKPYDPEQLLARLRHVLENRRLRRDAKTSLGVTVRFLGRDITVTSEREQILDLFISSVEDVVRTNEALVRRERELAEAKAQLEAYANEKALEARVSLERYRALLQNAGDAILVLDVEGRIVEANERATEVLARPKGELIRASLTDLLAKSDREEVRRRFARLRDEKQVDLGVRRISDAGVEERWCELSASLTPLPREDLVLLIARDVTDRQRTARELYESNERLRTLIEASPAAIVAVDRAGCVQLWNAAAERIFGWSEQEALGRPPPPIPGSDQAEYRALLGRALKGELLVAEEVVRKRRDGNAVELNIYAAPLRSAAGEIFGCMAILADVTERNQLEKVVQEREEVARANQAKSEFLSRMSHELRTPLNAILGFAQLLEMDELGEEQTESVEQIVRGGRHLLDLINEVLDISRIEAGKLSLSLEPVAAAQLLRDAVDLIGPLAAQRGVELRSEASESEGAFVFADLQRLKQVLLNFLSNAVKYNVDGGSVTVGSQRAVDGRLRLMVTDTGPGLSPHEQAKLFVPFERLEAEESGVPGTGLGLALSKGLAEAMGGEVGVESTPGVGSTFWIELLEVEAPRLQPAPDRVVPLVPAGGITANGSRTVLYIEDNISNVRLVERVLARPGMRLLTAMQGRLGLDLAREHRPDLILLDLNLPDISGEKVLKELQSHPELRETPVVIISADALPSHIERLLASGAREYLTKPFDMRRFIAIVNECLGVGR